MCDYSLMMHPNRLAQEGEQLVAHRYGNGSTGMVSLGDFQNWQARRPAGFWDRVKGFVNDYFCAQKNEPTPLVCIPPGAQLRLESIPKDFREQFRVNSCEDARFTQLTADAGRYRDALRFANGATVLLQLLPEGQRVTVVSLGVPEVELEREQPQFAGIV